jgi:hypothetical protein
MRAPFESAACPADIHLAAACRFPHERACPPVDRLEDDTLRHW